MIHRLSVPIHPKKFSFNFSIGTHFRAVYALTCSNLGVFIAVEHFNLTGYVVVHLSKADAVENVTAAEATVVVVTAVQGVTGVLTAENSEPQGKYLVITVSASMRPD